jgi:predicted aldo/keto reductase-like oxidoreductase
MGSCYAINLARTALDEGIVYLHTSSGYGEERHERLLGEVFRDRPRDSFVVATSPDLPYRFSRGHGRSMDIGKEVDPARIIESMEGSLQRLGLDHVDIYYLASVGSREAALHQPYLEAFGRLKETGKTRFVGLTTHEREPEVIRAATESGFWDVVLTAYNFRQTHRQQIREAIAGAAKAGIGVVGMKTQAGVYWDRMRLRKINMKAALKWVLADENVHTTIPAFSSYEEMNEDLEVMRDPELTPEERLDLRLGDEQKLAGLFCQQCSACRAGCPAGLDIPTLMRGYMYAYGHRQPGKARKTLGALTTADIPCAGCRSCGAACALGFDVRARVLEIARILDVPDAFLV